MYNYFQIILFILCLNCCTCKEERIFFQTTRKISSTEVFDSGNLLIGDTHQFIIKEKYAFIYSPLDTTSHLVIDLTNGDNHRAFIIGQGPGEILNPSSMIDINANKLEKKVEVYDIALNKLVSYNLDSILYGSSSIYESYLVFENSKDLDQRSIFVQRLNDSLLITQGLYNDAIFRIYNLNDNKFETQKASLYNKNLSTSDILKLGNIFSLSPNRKYISRATQMRSIIEGYEVSCDSIIKKFSIQYSFADKDNIKYGYISTCISNDRIFGLYSGNKISTESTAFTSKEIHVFDLKGNPIECLQIETPLCAIEWCESLQSIYGISNIPEMHIVKLEE